MKLLIPCFLLFSFTCFAQEKAKRGTIKIEKTECVLLENNDSVYWSVDKMPEFKGGTDSLNIWMNMNLRYPAEMMSGTVFCSFIVQIDGSITDITILKSAYRELNMEAGRLLKSMPAWNPGKCNGTLVAVKVNYPIKFIVK